VTPTFASANDNRHSTSGGYRKFIGNPKKNTIANQAIENLAEIFVGITAVVPKP
jgi:hypothetical protein